MNRRALLLSLALTGVLAAPAARAAEDGGTVSVFAEGSGSRALAQGGAVLTRADDPSAWMWNPAGIGLVSRASLQLEQSSPTQFDYRESSGGFVLPSWRLGAVALGYRQFGVDGIEARDSRNAVVGTDLADRQSELSLGYGRAFGPYGSAGAVLRARRHELAGRSANAFGADLGVLLQPGVILGANAQWLRDLTLALVSRNLLQPSMRLDIEDVADPRGARFGLGYQPVLPGGRAARFEVDVDATQGRNARLRSGIELSAHPMLDLRVGTLGGSLTSGTGVHLRHLDIDYAFEAGPATSAHRVGVGFRFGASTEESRASEERKRDEELDARLAKAFESRRAARLEELLTEARSAHEAGNLQDALDALGTARALEPNDARLAPLEAAYLFERATQAEHTGELDQAIVWFTRSAALAPGDSLASQGAERCRKASAQRAARTEALQNRYASALRSFASGDLAAARRELAAVVAARPNDADAQRMLATVDRSIDASVDQSLTQAARLTRVGAFDDAQKWIEQARALSPDSPRVSGALAALARARQLARSEAAPKPAAVSARTPRALSASDQAEVEKLWRQGQEAMQAGRTDEALRYWELVRSKDPSHARAAAALQREYLNRGMDAFAAGRLPEAISQWESALRIDPDNERARAYLSRAQEHLARTSEIGSR